MTKAELAQWLKTKRLSEVILVCPRCNKVDIIPDKHLDECSIAQAEYKMQYDDWLWK